jgi:predicted amidohydrolase
LKLWAWFFSLVSSVAFAQLSPIQEVFSPNTQQYPAERFYKVAVIQWANEVDTPLNVTSIQAETYKQTNRKALEKYIREAATHGAQLVVTPEFAVVGYPSEVGDQFFSRQNISPYVEPIPGTSTNFFSDLARELNITIHLGMVEKDTKSDSYFNAQVAISPQGKILGVYRKISLFGDEGNYVSAGNELVTYQSPVGKIGLAICADIYNSKVMGSYKNQGVKALTVPASWTIHNSAMSYFQSAARSTSAYILGANHFYFPDSGVVNPDGSKQSHIRQSMGVAYGFIPLLKRQNLR